VRPTDENQTGSRRPNLMSSSRRTSGEINILAMLDGQVRKPGPFSRLPRAAWYGSGGLLACALAGAVAWLVHDQTGSGFEGRVPAGPPVVPLEIVSETLPNPALQVGPPRALGAAVVDVAASPPDAAPAALPPRNEALALDEAGQGTPAPAAVMPAVMPAHVPAPKRADTPAVVPTSAPLARPPVHAPPRMPSRAAPAPRSALADARQPAAAHARRAAPVQKPKPAPVAVDTDVALISAIIQHMSQRGEPKDGAPARTGPAPQR
jgi:hypothetical protein